MVLQVLADLGRNGDDGNAVFFQQGLGADPRQLQDLRRLQGAGTQNHLAIARPGTVALPLAAPGHAGCASMFDLDA